MTAAARSSGSTTSERVLHALCESSFLKLWTYSNLYRDQGRKGLAGHGKEIADEIAFFDNRVLIFSDKDIGFPVGADPLQNWRRWYRRAIKESADQIFGAERWLSTHPDHVFLDRACSEPLPIHRSPTDEFVFHRIVVASGATAACRAAHDGGSGTLVVAPKFGTGADPAHEALLDTKPFVVGRVDPRGFVHVFDDVSLPIVLSTLDTISDFIDYLSWKEIRARAPGVWVAIGEEELLAVYVRERLLGEAMSKAAHIGGGLWHELQRSSLYASYLKAVQDSYEWDAIVDHLASLALEGRMAEMNHRAMPSPVARSEHERRLRSLARTSRLDRSVLARALSEFLKRAVPETVIVRTIQSASRPDSGYVLVHSPFVDGESSYREYRAVRQGFLRIYCMVFKARNPWLVHVTGLASEFIGRAGDISYDVAYIGPDDWTAEMAAEANKMKAELGILPRSGERHLYPRSPRVAPTQTRSSTSEPRERKRKKKAKQKLADRSRRTNR